MSPIIYKVDKKNNTDMSCNVHENKNLNTFAFFFFYSTIFRTNLCSENNFKAIPAHTSIISFMIFSQGVYQFTTQYPHFGTFDKII